MHTFLVKVLPQEGDDPSTLVHQLGNFAEQVAFEFMADDVARVPDMDSATTEVHIYVPKNKDLGTVSAYINRALRHNGLLGRSEVSRGK